jgi:hypothetical protein
MPALFFVTPVNSSFLMPLSSTLASPLEVVLREKVLGSQLEQREKTHTMQVSVLTKSTLRTNPVADA